MVRAFVPRERLPSKRMMVGSCSPLPIGCSRTVPTGPTSSLPVLTNHGTYSSRQSLWGTRQIPQLEAPVVPRPPQAILRTDAKIRARSGPQVGRARHLDSPISPPPTSLPPSITVRIGRKRGKGQCRTAFLEKSRSRGAEGRAGWVGCGSWAF